MAVDPHLPDRHGDLRGARRTPGTAAVPQLAGSADRARPRGAADDDAAGGGRYRAAVHAGKPRDPGGAAAAVGAAHRVLDDRGGHRPGLRLHAVPGGHPGGGAAHPRRAGRDDRPDSRGRALARPGTDHTAAVGAGPRARHRAGPGTEPGRVRGDHRLRRLQGGGHPHHAAGHLPGAGEGHSDVVGPGGRAHRAVLHHRWGDQRRLDRGGRPPGDRPQVLGAHKRAPGLRRRSRRRERPARPTGRGLRARPGPAGLLRDGDT